MKKKQLFKKVFANTVLGSMALSILLPSCSGYLADEYNTKDNIYGEFANDGEKGSLLVDVNAVEFSDAFQEHSMIIERIIQDVLSNKSSADLFCADIDAYLAQKNYAASIQLTEREKSIIRALADDDIRQATHSNDLKQFLTLCKQKGYLSTPVLNIAMAENFDYSKYFKSEDDYLKYRQIISNIYGTMANETMMQERSDLLIFMPLMFPFIVTYSASQTVTTKGEDETETPKPKLMQREPVLKLWTKESSKKFDYNIAHSELILKTANDYVAFISEEIPSVNKDALKALLIVNLEKYYSFE